MSPEARNGLQAEVEQRLGAIEHPTFQRPMLELGLIDQVRVEGDAVTVRVTLHAASEPLKHAISARVEQALAGLGLASLTIEWDLQIPMRPAGGDDPVPLVKNIVLVMSGKGGVGKSTAAANLALALARAGTRVGLLDADIYGPSVPTMLGVSGGVHSKDGQHFEPLTRFGMKLMSIGFMLESERDAIIWRGPMLQSALMQFLGDVNWGELDYLVLDLPPGTGDVALTLAQRLKTTGAVLVTTPQEVALQDVYKAVSMCKKLNIPVLGVIENMSFFIDSAGVRHELFGRGGGQKIAEFADAPLLGQIPLDPAVRESGDAGIPIVQAQPNHVVARAFSDVATQAFGTTDGPIATARLNVPHALAWDATGNQLFIGEQAGAQIRVLDFTTNTVSTLVTDTGKITSLSYDATGNRLFASLFDDNKVISVDVARKTIALLAGSGSYGEVDGPPTTAAFRSPQGVVVASKTTAFVADYHGPTIRKLVANGSGAFQTTTLAGLKSDEGLTDAVGPQARFGAPGEMALAPDNHTIYLVDGDPSCAVRTFDTNTRQVSTLAGGAGCGSSVDGTGVAAQFHWPGAMAMVVPTPGRPPVLLVAEERGVVRKVDTANARVTTITTGDDALPRWGGIAATATHIYVTGEGERKIFRVPVAGGAPADYAGTGSDGCDDGPASSATLRRPVGILSDGATTLFFVDQECKAIRRINLTNNTVQTVAGGNADDDEVRDERGTNAAFSYPATLMWDRQKKGFYVQDIHVVRWVDATTFDVKTVVGDRDSYGGVWVPPNPPRLSFPGGLVEGLDGEVYITSEHAILRWGAP